MKAGRGGGVKINNLVIFTNIRTYATGTVRSLFCSTYIIQEWGAHRSLLKLLRDLRRNKIPAIVEERKRKTVRVGSKSLEWE
ncbi:hypothetical protein, partial [Nostoc sp.]|uniref:hypothetical protein n=1 Tax=Nostoc sp. TaxID=1180 RepID=UPI002FFBAA70